MTGHIRLNVFLLPLRMPFLRCVRPLRSLSDIATSGSSPPFSIPAPNSSTPFLRGGPFAPPCVPPRSSYSSGAPSMDGTYVISTPPSGAKRTPPADAGLLPFDGPDVRRWPKVAFLSATRPPCAPACGRMGTRRTLALRA